MIKRITIGDLRLTFTAARITKVLGVNSQLEDGKHILMWDFDNTTPAQVIDSLREVQIAYQLPKIHLIQSKPNTNFMAYCFKRVSLIQAVQVIANTRLVDFNFLKYGLYRGRFTLRVSPKNGRPITYLTVLDSSILEDVSLVELTSWVKYETLRG